MKSWLGPKLLYFYIFNLEFSLVAVRFQSVPFLFSLLLVFLLLVAEADARCSGQIKYKDNICSLAVLDGMKRNVPEVFC